MEEEECGIKNTIMQDQLLLVGWYHSHPKFQADPSLRDCDAQLDYQIRMRGSSDITYTPCISTIISPYYDENPTLESVVKSIWVLPPNDSKQILEYGYPMLMQYSVLLDKEIPEYVRFEVQACAEHYALYRNELVKFNSIFNEKITFLEKLKSTLHSKLPLNQDYTTLWSWICKVLSCVQEDCFILPKKTTTIDYRICNKAVSIPYTGYLQRDEVEQESYSTSIVKMEKKYFDKKGSEAKVMTLQEQLCLPSGLNMNPVRMFASSNPPNPSGAGNILSLACQEIPAICAELLSPLTTPDKVEINTTVPPSTVTITEFSLHNSTATVSSSSASPSKSDILIASSLPPKSEVPLIQLRSQCYPVRSSRTHSNTLNTEDSSKYKSCNMTQSQSPTLPSTANDMDAASLAQLNLQLVANFPKKDLASIYQQHQTDTNFKNYPLNELASGKGREQTNNISETIECQPSKIANLPHIQELLAQNHEMMGNDKNIVDPSEKSSHLTFSSTTPNFYKTKIINELDSIKKDPSKLNQLMRSPDYAALLLHQAEALGATTLATLGLGSDLNFCTKSGFGPKVNPSETVNNNNLVKVSKILGFEACIQLAKSNDLNNFFQQQIGAVAAAALVNVSVSPHNTSKKQKQLETKPLNDYSSILQTYSKLFEPENSFHCSKIIENNASNGHHELTALFPTRDDTMLPAPKTKLKDTTLQLQQAQNSNQNQFKSALLCHQSESSDLGMLYGISSEPTELESKKAASSNANSKIMSVLTDSAIYNNTSQEKMGYSYFPQQHVQHDSNFFISPGAMSKLQKDYQSVMMMKPPRSTSTASSISGTQEAFTSPTTKSGAENSNAYSATNSKYSFNATDLAVSSIHSNKLSPIPLEADNNSTTHRGPSSTPPVDLSYIYKEELSHSVKGSMIKRLEFSSLEELVTPPPTKMTKGNDSNLTYKQ